MKGRGVAGAVREREERAEEKSERERKKKKRGYKLTHLAS